MSQDRNENPILDPRHESIRNRLRIVGPAVVATGLVLTVVGFASFFSSFGTFEPPRYFWCAFLGIPLVGVGSWLTVPAYLGAFTRYMSGEVAPVQKDTFNYLARGTSGGVRDLAEAVGQGFQSAAGAACPRCRASVPTGAKFCPHCGTPFTAEVCAACGAQSAPGAKFCHQCGAAMRTSEIA